MTYEIISVRKRRPKEIKTLMDIYEAIKKYGKNEQELFLVITLNADPGITAIHIASLGSSNTIVIQPREIFRHAIRDNATAIVIAHNHPSGELTPSPEDLEMTEKIIEAGKILGIKVKDHIILTKQHYYSFRQAGKIS